MTSQAINIIFDGPPGATSGRFVECELDDGSGVNAGEWIEDPRHAGWWKLRITRLPEHPLIDGLWTKHQVDAAFKLVRNPSDWKVAIDATVDLPSQIVDIIGLFDTWVENPDAAIRQATLLLSTAVTFHTGGLTEVTPIYGSIHEPARALRVRGDGYYHNIGS